jgi:hypothetical protein
MITSIAGVLHKDEKILGRKHIYLPHAQTAIYDSKVKLFLKRGISHQLGRDAVVRFECENSRFPPPIKLTAMIYRGFKVGRYPVLLPVWDRVLYRQKLLNPPKLAVVKTTSTIGLRNIFHKKLMITSMEETGVPGENHRPAASHWQTLSYNVVSKVTFTCVPLFSDHS